jgi:hypothetical protein
MASYVVFVAEIGRGGRKEIYGASGPRSLWSQMQFEGRVVRIRLDK